MSGQRLAAMIEAGRIAHTPSEWDLAAPFTVLSREALREIALAAQLGVRLPPDPSWDEIAARAGIEAPRLEPGDELPSALGTAQLYWPATTPLESRRRGNGSHPHRSS